MAVYANAILERKNGNMFVIHVYFFYCLKGLVWFSCQVFSICMNHTLRVGGSVFESLILEWNSSFDITHSPKPEASAENRKQEERKRIWPLQGDACFHGNVEHVLVCMMTSRMHILLSSLFFCQDADSVCASTQHMVQSLVRFTGGLCVRNVKLRRRKLRFTREDIDHSDSMRLYFRSLSIFKHKQQLLFQLCCAQFIL